MSASGPRTGAVLEEVTEQPRTLGRQDALRVKLHALDRERAVPHRHDLPLISARAHLEHCRQVRGFRDQGVVAPHLTRLRYPRKDRTRIVPHERGLAVHESAGTHDLAAEDLDDRLMTETHPQHRYPPGELTDHVHRDTGVVRRSRPRG